MIRKFLLITFALLGLVGNGVATADLYNYNGVVTLCTGTCDSFASLDLGSTITGTVEINTTAGTSFGDADVVSFTFFVKNPAVPVSGPIGDPVNDNPLVVDSGLGIAASNGTSGTTDATNEINGGQMLIEFLVPPFNSNGAFIVFDLSTGNGQICLFFATTGCIPGTTEAVKFEGNFTRHCGHSEGFDSDADGWCDGADNCTFDYNPFQENNDGDSEGDVCDPDDDNDGVTDVDESLGLTNPYDPDSDDDGIGDALDAFPLSDSNSCTGGDTSNATLELVVAVETTCAARATISVNPPTEVEDLPGYLILMAPTVAFSSEFSVAGQLRVVSVDPCPGCPYAIGDTGPAGGVVIYVTDGGLHGLEAAPVDQTTASPGVEWGCEGTAVGADGADVGTGMQNTADILNGCATTPITASVAADYMGPDGNTGGWFLPSIDELTLIFQNKAVVPNLLGGNYSSSTEFSGNPTQQALYLVMGDGSISPDFKSLAKNVRAIRAF